MADIRFLHITEYLLEMIEAGRLTLTRAPDYAGRKVAFHDTCKLGR